MTISLRSAHQLVIASSDQAVFNEAEARNSLQSLREMFGGAARVVLDLRMAEEATPEALSTLEILSSVVDPEGRRFVIVASAPLREHIEGLPGGCRIPCFEDLKEMEATLPLLGIPDEAQSLLGALREGAIEAIEKLTKQECFVGKVAVVSSPIEAAVAAHSIVRLGVASGIAAILMPTEAFLGIVSKAHGKKQTRITAKNRDAAVEILNLIVRTAKTNLARKGILFQPMNPVPLAQRSARALNGFVIAVKTSEGVFSIVLSMDSEAQLPPGNQ